MIPVLAHLLFCLSTSNRLQHSATPRLFLMLIAHGTCSLLTGWSLPNSLMICTVHIQRLLAPRSACRLLPPSCALELLLVLPTPQGALSNLSASCQFVRCCLDSAGRFSHFVPAYLCLKLDYVAPSLSILRVCHLPHVSYLSDEACTHRVHFDRHLFAKSLFPRRSFPDWATPVKLCGIAVCMLINLLLYRSLSLIQEGDHLLLNQSLQLSLLDLRRFRSLPFLRPGCHSSDDFSAKRIL